MWWCMPADLSHGYLVNHFRHHGRPSDRLAYMAQGYEYKGL
jgi:hypothetical protein